MLLSIHGLQRIANRVPQNFSSLDIHMPKRRVWHPLLGGRFLLPNRRVDTEISAVSRTDFLPVQNSRTNN